MLLVVLVFSIIGKLVVGVEEIWGFVVPEPPLSCAFMAASSFSTEDPDARASSSRSRSLPTEPVESSRPGGQQLVDGGGAGLQLQGLVLGALDGHAHVAHLLGDAGEGLVDPGLRLGSRIGGLDRLLAGAEGVHLRLEPGAGAHQFLLLRLESRVLVLEVLQLGGEAGLAGQGLAGKILAVGFKGTLRGDGVTVDLGAHLLGLELDAFATGGHVRHSPAHLAEQLELALVGVVQGLARVLVLV